MDAGGGAAEQGLEGEVAGELPAPFIEEALVAELGAHAADDIECGDGANGEVKLVVADAASAPQEVVYVFGGGLVV